MTNTPPRVILLVDDQDANRYTLCRTLRQSGYEVLEAASGEEALRLAGENPDLVILDVMLPDINGFEVCRRLKADLATAPIPVLHISAALRDDQSRINALEGGADGYLTMPIDSQVLLATIKALLRVRQAEEERRRLEAQLLQAQKLESLGVLAGGIAHDFNNLLQVIIGNTSIALMRLAADAPLRGIIENCEQAALRAADLTRQMLAYSGKGRFVLQAVDLSQVVRDMSHLLESAVSKRAELCFQLPAGLPAVEADADQLQQLVLNLVTNASEALGEHNGVVTVATGEMAASRELLAQTRVDPDLPEGRYVYFEVADTGSGMAAETRHKIFDPFFSTRFTGRGLGMAVVQGIVRGHRGAIQIDSELGRGTTVRVLLPARVAAAPPPEQAALPAPAQGTVLVVDDEEGVRTVARLILEEFGYRVLLAADGREGVEAFERHADEIGAVLLDMTMPEMSGEEAFHAIRRIRTNARVILSSGYSEEEVTDRFAGQGLAGFLQKPYPPLALIAKLQELNASHDTTAPD